MSNNDKGDKSCLRLFLSVDIVGSTNLKGIVNHATLLRSYEQSKKTMEVLGEQTDWTDEQTRQLLSVVGFGVEDWAKVLENQFADFHTAFLEKTQQVLPKIAKIIEDSVWKFLGDEMIYAVNLCEINADENTIHELVVQFTEALREIDKAGYEAESDAMPKALRMKGTAWTAGFPIRNRQIGVPGKEDKPDFLGPDMDIGFRIRNYSYPGVLCVSLELAYILAHVRGRDTAMCGAVLDWEKLKGVWNGIPYPIIWCTTPTQRRKNYSELRPWADGDTPRVEKWRTISKGTKTIRDRKTDFEEIYDNLPDSLFVKPPYIPGNSLEGDTLFGTVPEAHKQIRRLLKISQLPEPSAKDKEGKELTGELRNKADELLDGSKND